MSTEERRKDIAYPAAFFVVPEDEGCFLVRFADIYPGVTEGEGLVRAILMAEDLLNLMLSEAAAQCFLPSPLEKVKEHYPEANYIFYVKACVHTNEDIERIVQETGDDLEGFLAKHCH